jgi:soluble lytic murein transglycosylase
MFVRRLAGAFASRAGRSAAVAVLLLVLTGCATAPAPVIVTAVPAPVPAPPAPPKKQLPEISGPEEGFSLAMEAFKVGDWETAGLFAESVVERYPNTAWQKRSLFLLGRTLMGRDMTVEAEQILLRVPVEYPDLADYALFLLAEHRYAKKAYPEAVGLYERLVNNYPSSALVARATLRKAQALHDAGSFREAAASFEQVLKDHPRSEQAPVAGLGLGTALAAAGDLPAAARAYLDVSVRYPGNGNDAAGEQALASLRQRGADVPKLTADELYERGRNLFRTLQYDKAADAFRAALDADPSHPQKADMLLRSGIALYSIGKRPEAASTLERLLKAKLPDCRCAEALNWLGKSYSRLGLREEAVETYLKLVRMYPESDWADDALYLTGNVYRDANDMKKALKYYRRLVEEYPDSSFADSAIWWQGWAFYTAGDFPKAVQSLQDLVSRYPRSFLVNQALYWQGRAVERMGGREKALRYYRRIAVHGPYTYYGYRAAERLGSSDVIAATAADVQPVNEVVPEDSDLPEEVPDLADMEGPPVWTDEAISALSNYPAYRKTLELMYLGMKKDAAAELWSLQDLMPKRYGAVIGLSKAFFELGDFYSSLIIVLRNFDRQLERPSPRLPADLWLLAYPQGYWQSIVAAARRYGLDPYFVAAIIREESQFRPEALSPAGARGVMQVMPTTGEWIARMNGIRDFDRAKLFEADMNITIGAWYLSHLMKRFRSDLVLVSAAYNAGPEAVAGWSGRNGASSDADAFVETIPFMETRGYVKKVLRNYAEYKRIYGRTDVVSPLLPQVSLDRMTSATTGTRMCGTTTERCP